MTLALWVWVITVHHLSWANRLTYIILGLAVYLNYRLAFESAISKPWRRGYAFKATACLIAWTYYTLLIFGVITIRDFQFASRWIQPLVVFALCTSALLHRWERRQLEERKALEDRLKAIVEDGENKE